VESGSEEIHMKTDYRPIWWMCVFNMAEKLDNINVNNE
jgi:hypothetical protein